MMWMWRSGEGRESVRRGKAFSEVEAGRAFYDEEDHADEGCLR